MWALAVWLEREKEMEGVVPASWIKGDNVFWPPCVNAEKAMRENKTPDTTWRMFPLIKIKIKSESRNTCESYNLTSTQETDNEVEPKRMPKKRRYTDFITEDQNNTEDGTGDNNSPNKIMDGVESCVPVLPKPPPKLSSKSSNSNTYPSSNKNDNPSQVHSIPQFSNDQSTSRSSHYAHRSPSPIDSYSRRPYSQRSPRSSSSRSRSRSRSHSRSHSRTYHKRSHSRRSNSPRSSPRSHYNKNTPRSSSRSYSHDRHHPYRKSHSPRAPNHSTPKSGLGSTSVSPGKSDPYPMSTAKFQKRVMYLLTDMRNEIKRLNTASNLNVMNQSGLYQVTSPAGTIEEFNHLEAEMADIEKKNKLIQTLLSVGGNNLKDCVRRTMTKLITNEVMTLFNMKGNKGKRAFIHTSLFEVVRVSVMKANPSASEHEINKAVAETLKYAPDRRGGGGRKKND